MNGAAYLQRSAFLVEVAPLEPADLAAAQTRGDLRVEEIIPQRLGTDRFHESVELLFVEDFHGRAVELGDHRPVRRVLHDQPGAHRRLHDLMKQHVDAAHRGVGKATLASVAGFIRFLAHRVIELLHIPLRNGAQPLAAQRRLDVMTHVAAIPADGTLAQRRLGVACEPLLDPIAQRHVALLAQIRVPVAIDGAVELRHQLFLCFGEDGFIDRRAVLLMSDDDAAFPSSVFSFANKPVAVRSFSCHIVSPLFATQTHTTTLSEYPARIALSPKKMVGVGIWRRVFSWFTGNPGVYGTVLRRHPRKYGTVKSSCLKVPESLVRSALPSAVNRGRCRFTAPHLSPA